MFTNKLGCPIRSFKTWIDKLGLVRIGAGYILILCGVILVFKGLYYYLLLEKKNHFLKMDQIIVFAGFEINKDLMIGKVFISILNGFNISLIIYSYAIIFFDIGVTGNHNFNFNLIFKLKRNITCCFDLWIHFILKILLEHNISDLSLCEFNYKFGLQRLLCNFH